MFYHYLFLPIAIAGIILSRIFHEPSAARPQVFLWPRPTTQFDPQRINDTLPDELLGFLAREPLATARDEIHEICGLGPLARGEGLTHPGFVRAGDGFYQFDTGVVRGQLRLNGREQGIGSLIDVKTGVELAHSVGVMSYYRIFSSGRRYGDAARDWPTRSRLLPDGAVEVRFEPEDLYPFQLSSVYRWSAPEALDVETIIRAEQPLPKFEVFLSSYFNPQMQCSVYGAPNYFEQAQPQLIAADVNPLVDGTYLAFPRDREAILTIFDGRWELPPHPVQWSITRWLAGPLAVRRDEQHSLTVAVMAPPRDCFAVSTPYNKIPPDGPAAHASIYLSLFGRDIAAGETVRASSRIAVGRKLTNQQIVDSYRAYLDKISGGN